MSAIVGILRRDGAPLERADVVRMAEPLTAWGPDASGYWSAGSVAMGQRTLATTPEAAGYTPPTRDRDGALTLVADARIDNREELIAALGTAPGVSDDELILAAYERWGRDCPERLLGDFAFAIWDGRSETLFCARDHMGVRPMYYYLSERLFAFGTQIKALLRLPEVPRRLNEEMLADYLALLPPDKTSTFYTDIERLPPGYVLEATRDRVTRRSYWSLDARRELRLGSDAEYAEAFRELFTETVRCRLRGSTPVAALLSGGLDSSSIVCTARELLDEGERLITLSATFPSFRSPDTPVDERRYIDLVVAGGGVEANYLPADAASPLFEFLWRGEEPIPAAAMYMDWTIFAAAKERGVRVLLSGNDGDSVVGYGHAYLAELAWRGRWKTLLDELYALSRRYGAGRRDLIRHWVLSTLVPDGVAAAWTRFRDNGGPIYDPRSLISADFADRTGVRQRAREAQREDRPTRTEREAHLRAVESSLLTLLLELFARGAGQFSIEPRYPFFDRRLVEFCLALPGDQKLHRGWDRTVMRRAMEGRLPEEIQWRREKQNLTSNFNIRLLDNRPLLDRIVHGDQELVNRYIDVAALREAYARYLADPTRKTRDSFAVFWAATIALWLQESKLAR